MNIASQQPQPADQHNTASSPNSSAGPEIRRRSFPAHIIQAQQKEATAAVTIKDAAFLPSYDDATQPQEPSFIQRHFYRSSNVQGDDSEDQQARHFSFLSRGFLVCIGLITLMFVAGTVSAVLATVYKAHHKKQYAQQHPSPVKEAIIANFPDPAIIQHEGTWYAFATNNAAGVLERPLNASAADFGLSNVQIATSKNFLNWTLLDSIDDPLPVLGNWVNPTFSNTTPPVPRANVWAPEILQRPGDGKFVMYYSAAVANATRSHCVGAAVSDTGPAGPYTPFNDTLACPTEEGGAIDPVSFVDVDGTIYLAWKIDGNNAGHGGVCGNTVPPLADTPIMLQKMQADGITPDGPQVTILDRTKSDGPLVEAPSIVRSDDGIYFLFFSSGCTRTSSYDLKYAWAHNVTGPYTRAGFPLLETDDWGLLAPGSIGVRRSESGDVHMAFHARVSTDSGRVRAMFTSQLVFNGTLAKLVR